MFSSRRATVAAVATLVALGWHYGSESARADEKQKAAAFRVEEAVLKATPDRYKGASPTTIKFEGHIKTNGPGTVTYVFTRSDKGETEKPIMLKFDKAESKEVSTTWTLGSPGTTVQGWIEIKVTAPNALVSNKATFSAMFDGAKAAEGGKPADVPKPAPARPDPPLQIGNQPAPPNLNGIWEISEDSHLDGQVNVVGKAPLYDYPNSYKWLVSITMDSHGHFTGHYYPNHPTGLANQFEGQIYTSQRLNSKPVFTMVLSGNTPDALYRETYCGRIDTPDAIHGSTIDLAGRAGDFTMTRQPQQPKPSRLQ